MKRIKFLSLLLLLVLIFNMPIAAAGGRDIGIPLPFIRFHAFNITGQAWYTKFIDLTGYKGKNVSGTLEFELVPDTSASGTEKYTFEYEDFNGKTRTVNVTAEKHPGFQTFKYEVPFSSDDFVDPEFNRLCRDVRSDFGIIYTSSQDGVVDSNGAPIKPGNFNSANDSWIKPNAPNNFGYYNEKNMRNYIELFNHAFMHEWGIANDGTPIYSQDTAIYRSAKVTRSQFKTDEEYDRVMNVMNNHNLWVNWANDPEKHVAAWECFYNFTHNKLHDFIIEPDKAIRESKRNLLSGDVAFRNGTFSLFDYSYKKGSEYSAELIGITRPIAISKKYDASGNIVAIEKPLLPSTAQMDFESTNSLKASKLFPPVPQPPQDFQEDNVNIDVKYHILRYILKEKPSKGIDLQISNDEIIVDFIYHQQNQTGFRISYVNIYKDRASADAYRYRFPKRYKKILNMDGSTRFEYSRYTNMEFCHEITDRVQVKNKYIPTITPTPTTPQSYPHTGDSENVWVYGALLVLSIATAVFIRKKKYSNK